MEVHMECISKITSQQSNLSWVYGALLLCNRTTEVFRFNSYAGIARAYGVRNEQSALHATA